MPERKKRRLVIPERWRAALALGYILMFFSEFLFVNVYENFQVGGLIPMWIAYTVEAYVFLAIVTHFRVRNWWALFLAGAVYGWLLEGVIVQTMYLAFPFQVAFTGLSWHALIDVLVGWYVVRRTMFTGSRRDVQRVAGLIGLFWGFWAIWAWQEYDMLTTGEFAVFALASALPLMPAYAQLNRLEPLTFAPRRWELRLIAGLHVLWFGVVLMFIPWAALILPPLLALIFGALRRHRRSDAPATITTAFEGTVSREKYATLLLIPLVAVIWYAVFMALDTRIPTNVIVALATVPASVVLFVRALFVLYRREVVSVA